MSSLRPCLQRQFESQGKVTGREKANLRHLVAHPHHTLPLMPPELPPAHHEKLRAASKEQKQLFPDRISKQAAPEAWDLCRRVQPDCTMGYTQRPDGKEWFMTPSAHFDLTPCNTFGMKAHAKELCYSPLSTSPKYDIMPYSILLTDLNPTCHKMR